MPRPVDYPDTSLTPQQARHRFLDVLGPLGPPTTPLDLRRQEPEDLGGGLCRQKIVYDVSPGEPVAAWLFTHQDKAPRPGIVAMHSHGGSPFTASKDTVSAPDLDDLDAYAYRAALAGFVVLAPDATCFGERRPASGYSTDFFDEVLVTMELIARGRSLAWKTTWDIVRALDLLQAMSEVDSSRLGIIGHSGGSIQAYLAAICDTRIKVCVALHSFVTLRHQFWEHRLVHCLYPYVPNMVTAGIDFDQLIASLAPRKLFMGWGRQDEGTPEAMARAYAEALDPDCLELFESPGGHELTPPMLDAAIAFLHHHLETTP